MDAICKTQTDITTNSNGSDVNISSSLCDIKNLVCLREKLLSSCVENDDFNKKLSNDLILLIFERLAKKDLVNCTMVCKRWYQIAQTEVLWKKLDLNKKYLHENTLWHILSRGVEILRLAQAKIITSTSQEKKQDLNDNRICKVKYLDASMAMISPNNLAHLLLKCRNLKKLSLESCTLNEACCEAISHCINLTVLNLAMCEEMDVKCVASLLQLRNLTELNVAWCSLDVMCVLLLCKSLPPSVLRLNVSGCVETITDDNIRDLVNSCPHLVELDISDCVLLTEHTIHSIIELNKLQHLAINRCYRIPASTYKRLVYMPQLLYLDVFGLTEELVPKSVCINKFMFGAIARPTVGKSRGAIWGNHVVD